MKKRVILAAWLGFVIGGRLMMSLAAGDGLASRAEWIPFVYAFATAGLIVSAFLVLGEKRPRVVLLWAAAAWFFQQSALASAVLRTPGHALAAETLHLAAVALPLLAALLINPDAEGKWRWIRIAALLTFAGIPPLPGFFARVETLSALVHADLTHLAVLTAISQIAVLIAAVRLAASEPRAVALAPAKRFGVAGSGL